MLGDLAPEHLATQGRNTVILQRDEYPFTSDVRVPPAVFESISHQMEGDI